MKLTEKQKIEIYQKRKQGTPISCLSLEYGMNRLHKLFAQCTNHDRYVELQHCIYDVSFFYCISHMFIS